MLAKPLSRIRVLFLVLAPVLLRQLPINVPRKIVAGTQALSNATDVEDLDEVTVS